MGSLWMMWGVVGRGRDVVTEAVSVVYLVVLNINLQKLQNKESKLAKVK